jgi:hypothetical protein
VLLRVAKVESGFEVAMHNHAFSHDANFSLVRIV